MVNQAIRNFTVFHLDRSILLFVIYFCVAESKCSSLDLPLDRISRESYTIRLKPHDSQRSPSGRQVHQPLIHPVDARNLAFFKIREDSVRSDCFDNFATLRSQFSGSSPVREQTIHIEEARILPSSPERDKWSRLHREKDYKSSALLHMQALHFHFVEKHETPPPHLNQRKKSTTKSSSKNYSSCAVAKLKELETCTRLSHSDRQKIRFSHKRREEKCRSQVVPAKSTDMWGLSRPSF